MFHVLTAGAGMLGWHKVPAGFGGVPLFGAPAEPALKPV